MSAVDSRQNGRSGPVAGAGVGRHLLIVDDDDRIRELLKEYLAREGYRVTGAAHAAAARRLMELIEFDLVVLDIMMPGESGLDLTTWVRSKADTSSTPSCLRSRSSRRRPVSWQALMSAAAEMMAVPCWSSWKTGMDIWRLSSCSM